MATNLDKDTLVITDVWANRINYHDLNPIFEDKEIQVLGISWAGDLGYGTYELTMEHDENGNVSIHADSEYMDDNDDKSFLSALLEKLVEKVEVDR